MSFHAATLASTPVNSAMLEMLIERHHLSVLPGLRRLWDYYRNPMQPASDGPQGRSYRLAHAQGLPARLTRPAGGDDRGREIVIENDIAWRVHTLTDFMFGKPVALQSLAHDPAQRQRIETFLTAVFDANGGAGFFHDLSLLGAVYGYVDVLLRLNPADVSSSRRARRGDDGAKNAARDNSNQVQDRILVAAAPHFILETIEAPRVIPVLHPDDYRRLDAYVLHLRRLLQRVERASLLDQIRSRVLGRPNTQARQASIERTQIWTDQVVLTFEGDDGRRTLIDESVNTLGRIPVIHIQNLSQPFFYEGLSEVEPLIPLQDELNTRLSDRANRVTFQSFKMYLGKGIENFTERPVGPGQMWSTDNVDASIEQFGGDGESPSEESHISEIRDAMDKISGVTAVAAGLLRNKVGNLTSENALRIVMMGLLAKTEKRRVSYGAGIKQLCELLLHAADVTGILPNAPDERGVRIDWPNPLPADEAQHLRNAKTKIEIGIPRDQVLMELGYADTMHK